MTVTPLPKTPDLTLEKKKVENTHTLTSKVNSVSDNIFNFSDHHHIFCFRKATQLQFYNYKIQFYNPDKGAFFFHDIIQPTLKSRKGVNKA